MSASLHYEDERCALYHGDCLEALAAIPDCSIDLVLTDPPYGLSDHRPSDVTACLQAWLAGQEYRPRAKGGFMGRQWDAWVPGPEVWRECLRVLRPGGHVLAFGGTRSMDLMSMAVRLSGFELRDAIGYAHDGGGAPVAAWVYGSGFPKSLDVSKAIDKRLGAERPVVGTERVTNDIRGGAYGHDEERVGFDRDITAPATPEAARWQGWGTALKPAWEPILIARKPLCGTVAENVLAHGTGALNVDSCRVEWPDGIAPEVGTPGWGGPAKKMTAIPGQDGGTVNRLPPSHLGRWPANVIHDASNEIQAAFAVAGHTRSGGSVSGAEPSACTKHAFDRRERVSFRTHADQGSPSRFFYAAKASQAERASSKHPTVKPLALMRYLARLACPPGGVVLDPFTGSGTTMEASLLEGFCVVGIEREGNYLPDIMARLERAGADVPGRDAA